MKMTPELRDKDLDGGFGALRAAAPIPSAALLVRIEADAEAERLKRHDPRKSVRPAPPLWSRLIAVLGGGPAFAGLVGATVAGVWLGVAQPAPVSVVTDEIAVVLGADFGFDQIELIPTLDLFSAEG